MSTYRLGEGGLLGCWTEPPVAFDSTEASSEPVWAAPSGTPLAGHHRDLAAKSASLARLEAEPPAAEYAAVDEDPGATVEAVASRARVALAPRQWVQTDRDGVTVARTRLGLTTASTALASGIDAEAGRTHAELVGLVLQSRLVLARSVVTTLRIASLVAVAAAGPFGLALALPRAWRLVEGVLR